MLDTKIAFRRIDAALRRAAIRASILDPKIAFVRTVSTFAGFVGSTFARLIGWAATIFVMGGLMFVLGALVSLPVRFYVFLKYDVWLSSLCEITSDLVRRGLNGPSLPDSCADANTSWLGINSIINWVLHDADAFLSLLLIGAVPLAALGGVILLSGLLMSWLRDT
jgi:hypothetical protein